MTEFGMNLNAMMLFRLSVTRDGVAKRKRHRVRNECPCENGLNDPSYYSGQQSPVAKEGLLAICVA